MNKIEKSNGINFTLVVTFYILKIIKKKKNKGKK